jgi:MoxR-like ATPase
MNTDTITEVMTTTSPSLTAETPSNNGAHAVAVPAPVLNLADPAIAVPLQTFQQMETELRGLFLERDEALRVAFVAVLSGEHVFMIGPPGTAKSALMNAIAARIFDPLHPGKLPTFSRLLTKYTSPQELFGPLSVQGLERDEYRVITTGKAAEAYFAFFDELYKAGSAILNTLLQLLNERVYNNGSEDLMVPLITAFAASNELPEDPALAPIHDRFLLQVRVDYLKEKDRHALIAQSAALAGHKMRLTHARRAALLAGTPFVPNLSGAQYQIRLDDLFTLQEAAHQVEVPATVIGQVNTLVTKLQASGFIISDRRAAWLPDLLRSNALLSGRIQVEDDDLEILAHALWNQPSQQPVISREIRRLVNPVNARALELADQAAQVMSGFRAVASDKSKTEGDISNAGVECATKLRQARKTLDGMMSEAKSQGMNTAKIQRALDQVVQMQTQTTQIITGEQV